MDAKRLLESARLRFGIAVFLSGLSVVAYIRGAQAATPASGGNGDISTQEVIITGTSIKRANAETALPVQVLSQEDIARTGATSVEELFHGISAAASFGSNVSEQSVGANTGSIATISLRGLRSARTLVLINGRRSPVYGGGPGGADGSSVDINAIPISAIERVEILKDGASAIYGSDAIAGVVNFILRSDFQGLDVTATAGTPAHSGGGTEESMSAYGGLGDMKTDRYNVALGASFDHQGAIMGSSRPFATRYSHGYGNDVTSTFAFPANVALPGRGTRNPNYPDCGSDSIASVYYPNQCRFDNSPFDSLQPEQRRINVNFTGGLALAGTSQLYAESSFSEVKTTNTVQPVPLSYQNPLLAGNPYNAFLANLLATQYPHYHNTVVVPGTGAFLLPPTSPYYPAAFAAANGAAGQPLNLIYRDFANGLRESEDTAHTTRVVGGVKGDVAGWDYDASLLYAEVRVKERLESGFPLYSLIMPLLDGGTINPFGETTDPAALAAAKATEFVGQDFSSKTSITSLEARGSRELVRLPSGPLSAAVGAELRRETFQYNPAAAIQTGDIAGQGGNQLPESASRNVQSGFVELNAVALRGLELDAAARVDNYQGVGSTVNPKASLRWQPGSWVLLRASAGTGFRAPSLTDLYATQARAVTGNGTRDPIQCPQPDSNNPSCSFQFTTITGGNPHLTPEKSTTLTLGTVLDPVRNLSIDVDAFWIFLRNEIVFGGLPYAVILQNAQTATQFANLITRDASGRIIAINQTNANLFKVNLYGVDIDLKYAVGLGSLGELSLLGTGTYFFKYDSQNADGSWTGQLDRGLTNEGGVIARWRHSLTIIYDFGSISASVTQNFQKGYSDIPSSFSLLPRTVSPSDTIDAQVAYTGVKSFKFTVGAKNVFDKVPPYANYASQANNFVGGYDITYGDPRGRFVYLNVGYALR
jgi:iron complex outermembrane receptor protein